MDELFKLLGFGTPVIYAGATYALFHWLAACRTERRGGDSALVKPAFGFMPG
jgi:hypothetical protein